MFPVNWKFGGGMAVALWIKWHWSVVRLLPWLGPGLWRCAVDYVDRAHR